MKKEIKTGKIGTGLNPPFLPLPRPTATGGPAPHWALPLLPFTAQAGPIPTRGPLAFPPPSDRQAGPVCRGRRLPTDDAPRRLPRRRRREYRKVVAATTRT